MNIESILLILGIVIGLRLLSQAAGRVWPLTVASVIFIFWLQPAMPIRFMDFWLPCLTLLVVVLNWLMITPLEDRKVSVNWPTLCLIVVVILGLASTRLITINGWIVPNRPPLLWKVAIFLAIASLVIGIVWRFVRPSRRISWMSICGLIIIFIFIKTPALAQMLSSWVRQVVGQSTTLAGPLDWRWLGFSYIAFRIIHTLRDQSSGRLPQVPLNEYICYVLFPPAISAGPIDRVDRFLKDLREPLNILDNPSQYSDGFTRIILGLFKKFALADTLGLVALNSQHAEQTTSAFWLWVLLYAYALQIYFDFSGYTDIAIGLGKILGINLPENFNKPYLNTNLTLFWNNWHMTLTQWFRSYFYNPLTRWFRRSAIKEHAWLIILIMQLANMILIGLWHGVTASFVVWGLWHGLGLFIQNRYSKLVAPLWQKVEGKLWLKRIWTGANWVLTFNYVALGWIWFVMPDLSSGWQVFIHLFGGAGF
jgi:alginate O-acetyltransferase complex protein AlgI